jgi:hypothetical protein
VAAGVASSASTAVRDRRHRRAFGSTELAMMAADTRRIHAGSALAHLTSASRAAHAAFVSRALSRAGRWFW